MCARACLCEREYVREYVCVRERGLDRRQYGADRLDPAVAAANLTAGRERARGVGHTMSSQQPPDAVQDTPDACPRVKKKKKCKVPPTLTITPS